MQASTMYTGHTKCAIGLPAGITTKQPIKSVVQMIKAHMDAYRGTMKELQPMLNKSPRVLRPPSVIK